MVTTNQLVFLGRMNAMKTVLITGAGSGFGRLAAFDLARLGYRVIAGVQIWPQAWTRRTWST